jgi:hypothetical protein
MSESIGSFFNDAWQPLLAVATAAGAVFGYVKTHRRELSWKRTEFICAQLRALDTDPKLFEMLTILEGRHQRVTLDELYDEGGRLYDAERQAYQQDMDSFLNFIWCLCFAYLELRSLTDRNILCVGRYLDIINGHGRMREYCLGHGYSAIIKAARRVRRDRLSVAVVAERLLLPESEVGETAGRE